jgi:hypothetical protein
LKKAVVEINDNRSNSNNNNNIALVEDKTKIMGASRTISK